MRLINDGTIYAEVANRVRNSNIVDYIVHKTVLGKQRNIKKDTASSITVPTLSYASEI